MALAEINNDTIETKRLLWIDDRVDIHRALIRRIEAVGVKVTATETLEDGINHLDRCIYDHILLDAMLGHQSSLPEIPRLLTAGHGAALSICSGFMYQDELKSQRNSAAEKTGLEIGIVEKAALPDIDSPEEVTNFLNKIFVNDEPKPNINGLSNDGDDILLPFHIYNTLGIDEKLSWLVKVGASVQEVADSLFSEGIVYVLFCGNPEKPVILAQNYDEIPTEEQVLQYARKEGYAPLAIHNLGIFDDIPNKCCSSAKLNTYPALKVTIENGESEEVHFDSGASLSVMSYEWYCEKGWIPYTDNPNLLRVGEMLVTGVRFKIENCTFTDSVGAEIAADFSAYWIINWKDTRLAIPCGPQCDNAWCKTTHSREICRFRTGLLGRSLPRHELKVNFAVDFQNIKIIFLDT